MLGKPGHPSGSKLPAPHTNLVADIFHSHGLTFGCLCHQFAVESWSRRVHHRLSGMFNIVMFAVVSSFCFDFVGIGFVLGHKLEILVSRPKEHLTAMQVSLDAQAIRRNPYLSLIQSL